MANPKLLFIPIRLDALLLPANKLLAEAVADFSKLPYKDSLITRNSGTAYLGESVITKPFQNQNLRKLTGVHLHWALPDALTAGVHNEQGTSFPIVPNRWIILRETDGQFDKKWVVESDYMYPTEEEIRLQSGEMSEADKTWLEERFKSIKYPVETEQRGKDQPYRYMGRQTAFEEWSPTGPTSGEYLNELTAIGYGEPTFHAFFPNCHSVFGAYDPEITSFPDEKVTYYLIGYYQDEEKDVLKRVKEQATSGMNALRLLQQEYKWNVSIQIDKTEFIDRLEVGDGEGMWLHLQETEWLKSTGPTDIAKVILPEDRLDPTLEDPFFPDQEKVEILLEELIQEKFPDQLILFTSLSFDPLTDPQDRPLDHTFDPPGITLGDTSLEALSSHLANLLGGDEEEQEKIEDQLEALHLSEQLEKVNIDFGPKFQEKRHEAGFNAVPGGWLWSINIQSPNEESANAKNASENIQQQLPEEIAFLLNELNLKQKEYDQQLFEIEADRKQLFVDWYKYMLSLYPTRSTLEDHPDADETKFVIEERYFGEELVRIQTEVPASLDGRILSRDVVYYKMILSHSTPIAQDHIQEIVDAQLQNLILLKEETVPFTRSSASDLIGRMVARDVINPDSGDVIVNRFSRITQPHTNIILPLDISEIDILIESEPLAADQNLPHLIGRILSNPVEDLNSAGEIIIPAFTKLQREHIPLISASGVSTISHFQEETISLLKFDLQNYEDRISAINMFDPFQEMILQGMEQFTTVQLTEGLKDDLLSKEVLFVPVFKEEQGALLRKIYDTIGLMISDLPTGGFEELTNLLDNTRNPNCTAQSVKDAFDQLAGELESFNQQDEIANAGLTFSLQQSVGPRYWEPTEPVVLLTGDIVEPSNRYGRDGLLSAHSFILNGSSDLTESLMVQENYIPLLEEINNLSSEQGFEFAFQDWEGQPWNPMWMEWEMQLEPLELGSNLDNKDTGDYSETFITDHYQIGLNEVELSYKNNDVPFYPAASFYSGRSILTAHSGRIMKEKVSAFLVKNVLPDYITENSPEGTVANEDLLNDEFEEIKSWYEGLDGQDLSADNMVYSSLLAYEQLEVLKALSQVLSGANQAFLQLKQSFQLPIDDPIGFDDYRPFTALVNALVGEIPLYAPQPLREFNPIRTGNLKITDIRLVDSFGQTIEIDRVNSFGSASGFGANATDGAPAPVSEIEITVYPRIVQPSRLAFRWLSAKNGIEEMNDHPASNPVCGWVLPNHLDNSLAIYDQNGLALGSLNQNADWTPVPGQNDPVELNEIDNPHLLQMVQYLIERDGAFLQNFLTTIDQAMNNINPERFSKDQAMSLLVGRPMALVRASVNLELLGAPAVDQSWDAFQLDETRPERQTDGASKVKFPIRIGDHQQLNDGLIGYWRETSNGNYEHNIFYSIQGEETGDNEELIVTRDEENIHIQQSIDDPSLVLAMLIDPAGVVHASSGILPVKSINIPENQYSPALKAIEVTFLTAPLYSDQNRVELSLPLSSELEWNWLEKREDNWVSVDPHPKIYRSSFSKGLTNILWEEFKMKGWVLNDPVEWIIAPVNNRQPLDPDWAEASALLADILGEPGSEDAPVMVTEKILEENLNAMVGDIWTSVMGPPNIENDGVDDPKPWLVSAPDGEGAYITDLEDRTPGSYQINGVFLKRIFTRIAERSAEAIIPMEPNALFAGRKRLLREGWLKLKNGSHQL